MTDLPNSALNFPSAHWAVFNNHVNRAGARALADVKRSFPASNRHLRALIRMNRTGIMEIFKIRPTGPSKEYAIRCFAYANKLKVGDARARLKVPK